MLQPRSIPAFVIYGLLLYTGSVRAADCKVSGSIRVGGKPLAAGKVTLHLDDGQFVGAKVKDGKFAIDRVPVGTRKITVEGNGVPAKYASEDISSLKLEVKKGNAVFDIVLRVRQNILASCRGRSIS